MAEDRDRASRGLGRGLSALIGDERHRTRARSRPMPAPPRKLPVAFFKPNPLQPRQDFDAEELKDLADSIREKGMLQPILVRPTGEPKSYEIVAGERRWRAAQTAKLHECRSWCAS